MEDETKPPQEQQVHMSEVSDPKSWPLDDGVVVPESVSVIWTTFVPKELIDAKLDQAGGRGDETGDGLGVGG